MFNIQGSVSLNFGPNSYFMKRGMKTFYPDSSGKGEGPKRFRTYNFPIRSPPPPIMSSLRPQFFSTNIALLNLVRYHLSNKTRLSHSPRFALKEWRALYVVKGRSIHSFFPTHFRPTSKFWGRSLHSSRSHLCPAVLHCIRPVEEQCEKICMK